MAARDDLAAPLITVGALQEATLPAGATGSSSSSRAGGASVPQTAASFMVIFCGTGLLSMPYALAAGGVAALAMLAGVAAVFALSAHLLCRAVELLPEGTPKTFPALGACAAGPVGCRLVMGAASLELGGSALVVLIITWRSMELFLPPEGVWGLSSLHVAALLSAAVLVPLLCAPSLARLAGLSALGFAASVLLVGLVLSLPALDPHRSHMVQQPPPPRHWFSALGSLKAVGVFAMSCSGHSTLPSLRNGMRTPARFPAVLTAAFSMLAGAYALVAGAGYWYFGDAASELVSTDIATNSVYVSVIRWPIERVLAALIIVNCLTKYPALVMVLQEMLATVGRGNDLQTCRPLRHEAAVAVRLALFALSAGGALMSAHVLGEVISLTGGICSISTSLLLPTAFYLRLAGPRAGPAARAALALLLVAGACVAASITASNLQRAVFTPAAAAAAGALPPAWLVV